MSVGEFSAGGGFPHEWLYTSTPYYKVHVRAARGADRVLSSTPETAPTRAAGDGHRQPRRGGRVQK